MPEPQRMVSYRQQAEKDMGIMMLVRVVVFKWLAVDSSFLGCLLIKLAEKLRVTTDELP